MSTEPALAADRHSLADGEASGEPPAEALRLWIALARCYRSFSHAVTAKISEYGLTTPHFGVLEALYHLGPLPLGELADKLLVTGGNVTYVMDRLEKQGLVSRRRSGEDRRVVEAHLLPAGRELIEQVFPGHGRFVGDLVDVLDPEERAEMRRLLKKLGKSIAAEPSATPGTPRSP